MIKNKAELVVPKKTRGGAAWTKQRRRRQASGIKLLLENKTMSSGAEGWHREWKMKMMKKGETGVHLNFNTDNQLPSAHAGC